MLVTKTHFQTELETNSTSEKSFRLPTGDREPQMRHACRGARCQNSILGLAPANKRWKSPRLGDMFSGEVGGEGPRGGVKTPNCITQEATVPLREKQHYPSLIHTLILRFRSEPVGPLPASPPAMAEITNKFRETRLML